VNIRNMMTNKSATEMHKILHTPDRKAHVKSPNIIPKQSIKHDNIYLGCSNVSGVQVELKHNLSKRIHSSVMKCT